MTSITTRVGCNPIELHRRIQAYLSQATEEQVLALRDAGAEHWPALAAAAGGVLEVSLARKTAKEDRTYTVGTYPLQSIPRDSGIRGAFHAAEEGHVLIDLDWRASHWQILAVRSGDANLLEDLRTGDLYSTQFPAFDRSAVKAGLASRLNGGGRAAIAKVVGEENADEFLRVARDRFKRRWPRAQAYLRGVQAAAVRGGWVAETERHRAGGIGLMRLEAQALWAAFAELQRRHPSVRMVLPMHDGMLISAPEAQAEEVRRLAARLMVGFLHDSVAEVDNADTWVKSTITRSWGEDGAHLLGAALRARAYAALRNSTDVAELTAAAALFPTDAERAVQGVDRRSARGAALHAARRAVVAANDWAVRRARAHAPTPPVNLGADARPTYTHLVRVLSGDRGLPAPRLNVRGQQITLGGRTADDSVIRRTYLQALETRYGWQNVAYEHLFFAAYDVAAESEYDPVRDYFDSLTWDGVPRADHWLAAYAGVADTPLAQAYASRWLMGLVARAYKPGEKVDTMLVLTGPQGARKSSLAQAIAPCGSYAAVHIDPGDKDSVLRATRYAVVEWPELAGASKREQEALKSYFSQLEDIARPPYAKGDVVIPRRHVFIGTSNETDFLRDASGSRRYWPVTVGEHIDIEGVLSVRDQLWAEAVARYKAGQRWWLTREEDAAWRAPAAEAYSEEDPFEAEVRQFLWGRRGERFRLDEVLAHLGVKTTDKPRLTKDISKTLRRIGCRQVVAKVDGTSARMWEGPPSGAAEGQVVALEVRRA